MCDDISLSCGGFLVDMALELVRGEAEGMPYFVGRRVIVVMS